MKRLVITVYILISFIVLISVGCSSKEVKEDITVKDKKMLSFFKENNKECSVLYVNEGDVNGDSLEDMVVVFKHDGEGEHKGETEFTVVLNSKEKLKVLGHHKAPVENQKVEFKDIDKKSPTEFVVSGSKNGSVGYSLYRVQDETVVDVFGGEGMDPC